MAKALISDEVIFVDPQVTPPKEEVVRAWRESKKVALLVYCKLELSLVNMRPPAGNSIAYHSLKEKIASNDLYSYSCNCYGEEVEGMMVACLELS